MDPSAMIKQWIRDVFHHIPEDQRPDLTEYENYFAKQFFDPDLREYEGVRLMPAFSPEMIDFVKNKWEPWQDDVIIASYPKTGTTWLRNIVRNLLFYGDAKLLSITKSMAMPHIYLETGTILKFELLDKFPWKRRVLGTHLQADLLNMKKLKKTKIIYTIRNPKDQLISLYNMMKDAPYAKNPEILKDHPLEFDEFFKAALEGRVRGSKLGEGYMDHILSWYPYRNDDNVLFIYFEDIKRDPAKEIQKVAKFLNVDISEEGLKQVVEITSFGQMQISAATILKVMKFFRKGDVGDWKNHLSEEQSRIIDEKCEEKLKDTDIKFTYKL